MAYEKHNFEDGNVLHAADLNAMEDQIAANETAAGAAEAAAAAAATAAEGAVQKMTDEGTHVYGHNGPNQSEYTVYVSPSANTIPYRTSGGRVKVGTPSEDNDAATKAYVDARAGVDTADIERKLKFLYELTRGQAWDYETDSNEAYSKAIPSGARMASVNAIGGKTFKFNQILDNGGRSERPNGVTATHDSSGLFTFTGTATANGFMWLTYSDKAVAGHWYFTASDADISVSNGVTSYTKQYVRQLTSGERIYVGIVTELNKEYNTNGRFWCCDMTVTFGAGNEPTTVDAAIAAYRALGIDITQPQPYDLGSIKHTAVTEVVVDNMPIDKTSRIPTRANALTAGTVIPALSYNGYTNFHGTWKWENGGFHISGFNIGYAPRIVLSAKPNTEYTLSGTMVDRLRLVATLFDKDGKWISYQASTYEIGYISYTFTTTANTAYIAYGVDANGAQVDRAATNMMIAEDNGTPYSPYNIVYQPIPSSVLALDGYGWSAGTASNRIYREGNKWWYKKEVDITDLGQRNWYVAESGFKSSQLTSMKNGAELLCNDYLANNAAKASTAAAMDALMSDGQICCYSNQPLLYLRDSRYTSESALKAALSGVMLYYELAEPILTDITDYMANLFDPVEVEAGGSITFESESKAAVPTEVEYLLKLSEVG